MASNLSTIGFAFSGEEDFKSAMVRLAQEARERLATPEGEYAIWRSRSGAEIWFQIAKHSEVDESDIIGLTPFFEGTSQLSVSVTEVVCREGDTALEGAFIAWVVAGEDVEGIYPIVFDAVDFAAWRSMELPAAAQLRVAGFAREVKAFASAEAFLADQAGRGGPGFSAQSFFPMGLLSQAMEETDGDGGEPPSSAALLTGRVRDSRLLANEVTGSRFLWMSVESLEATFDILADPDVVVGEIVQGGTVEVACLLFGRFVQD